MKRLLLFFLLSLFIPYKGLPQTVHHEHFGVNEGLSSSEVYDVVQDDLGYLWFSTDNGLSRYDGYGFTSYGLKDGVTDNTVFRLVKDGKGRILCSTFNHRLFYIVPGHTPEFVEYPHNDQLTGISPKFVIARIQFNSKGDLYLVFLNSFGYLKIDGDGNTSGSLTDPFNIKADPKDVKINVRQLDNDKLVSYHSCESSGSPNQLGERVVVFDIPKVKSYFGKPSAVRFPNDTYLVGHTASVDIYNPNLPKKTVDIGSEVIRVDKLNDSLAYVATMSGGLHLFDQHGKKIRSLMNGFSVSGARLDHEDGLWVTTLENGVFRIKSLEIYAIQSERSFGVSDLEVDHWGNLWIGKRNGDVIRYKNGQLESVHTSDKNRPAYMAGTWNDSVMYYKSGSHLFCSSSVDSMQVWFCTGLKAKSYSGVDSIYFMHSTGVFRFPWLSTVYPPSKITVTRPYDILFTDSATFLATKEGLVTIEGQHAKPVSPDDETLTTRFNSMDQKQGVIALGSHGRGLVLWRPSSGTREVINDENGLKGNIIRDVLFEDDSTLWLCTNAGVSRIRFDGMEVKHIVNLTAGDGLVSNETTSLLIHNDTVWVGSRNGVNYFNKRILDIAISTRRDLFLAIRSIEVNDEAKEALDLDGLDYNENRLVFSFGGISFNLKNQIQYRYRLQGLESTWNYTTNRQAVYSSVPPGKYSFVLQAKSQNGDWSTHSLTLPVSIALPFWETWWFVSLLVLIVLGVIYLFFKVNILSYNRDIVREMLRQVLKRIRRRPPQIVVRDSGSDVRIETSDILFVKSDGNYLEIHTTKGKHVTREKIGRFLDLVPDRLEFIRVRRSYIVRIDRIEEKGKKHLVVGGEKINIGETYLKHFRELQLE